MLDAADRSEIRKTSLPGVWWTKHADVEDIKRGPGRLPELTKIARRMA